MDLKQLQYFVVSVDCGSFKKAAEVLYTSQPHISKTVRNLEEELQAELLKRKARGVEVTDMGKKYGRAGICTDRTESDDRLETASGI